MHDKRIPCVLLLHTQNKATETNFSERSALLPAPGSLSLYEYSL